MSSFLHKLRSRFFSPNSDLELYFRTIYHKANTSRIAFFYRDSRARSSYKSHLMRREDLAKDGSDGNCPFVTFLLAIKPDEKDEALRTIHSFQTITGGEWQLFLLLLDESLKSEIISVAGLDERIVFYTDRTLRITDTGGEYLVFCKSGDVFSPNLLNEFGLFYKEYPDRIVYYSDCEYREKGKSKLIPLLKPSLLSVDVLMSVNMLTRGFFDKEFVLSMIQGLTNPIDLENIEYDLSLSAVQIPEKVCHISKILLRQQRLSRPDRKELFEVVSKHLRQLGLSDVSYDERLRQPHFSWKTDNPRVAIIIPTKNHYRLLQALITSLALTSYQNYKIILIDNASNDPGTLELYNRLADRQNVSIVPYNEPFNYSRAINLGVANSDSDLVLFLNDDMQVIHNDWVDELVRWAQRPEIGVVGTKLIRRNHTVQHGGIVIGLNEFVGHIYLNAPEDYNGLYGSVNWYRNYQALTGACQMVRRSVYEEAGGYDEDFRLAFGDIDFCLKVQAKGYRNVYTPFAYLYHLEGKSRGYVTPIEDINQGYQKLFPYLSSPDPFFSENLTLSVIPGYLEKAITAEERKSRIIERRRFYLQS